MTMPAADEPRETRGYFAVVGPGRKAVGDRIAGSMTCSPALHGDSDFPTVFAAAAPVRLRVPKEAIAAAAACEEAARIGFFSCRGALMWPGGTRARTVGELLTLPGVRIIDGT